MADKVELLFFDTFSHESSEELNLDLVQFPKPVFISEIRIIPLGARVQADFPGGVRLGATNPSQFDIEFFVNDLSKPGASTFESLGGLEYKQNCKIHLETDRRQIPTDGLVLRGWYTTITLAVYGVLTKTIQEQIIPQTVLVSHPSTPATTGPVTPDAAVINSATAEWVQQLPQVIADATYGNYGQHAAAEYAAPWPEPAPAEPPPRRRADKDSAPPVTRSRARPHTPPKPEDTLPQGSDRTHVKKEPVSPPAAKFVDSLSPGDVESISDTEISDLVEVKQEPAPAPPPAVVVTVKVEEPPPPAPPPPPPDDLPMDVEQFEPILSDEEIVDEADPMQFQDMDYDFNDEEESSKTFNPFTCDFQPMVFLTDPSESEVEARCSGRDDPPISDEAAQLSELIERAVGAGSEDWVHIVEQTPGLLAKALPSLIDKTDVIGELIGWVNTGLDFDAAVDQPQPGYKVRHLKAGIRLTEALCQCGERLTVRLIDGADVQNKLIGLYRREYMALSIKLMILKALDASLSWQQSVDLFLGSAAVPPTPVKQECNTTDITDQVVVKQERDVKRILGEVNGYRTLVSLCLENQLARVKFALNGLLRKLHVFEVLSVLRERAERVTRNEAPREEDVETIAACLEEVAHVYKHAQEMLAQPKRFLPVSAQFEIGADAHDPYPALYAYFRAHRLLESTLVLLASPLTLHLSTIVCPAQEVLSALAARPCGLRFLLASAGVSAALVRLLLGEALDEGSVQAPLQRLGLKLAYRLQTLQLVDCLLDATDHNVVLQHLHGLYCLGATAPGKLALAHVLGSGTHLAALLRLFNRSARPAASPARAYAADLIVLTVKLCDDGGFLLRHGRDILRAAATQEGARLHEAAAWLAPLDAARSANDDIAPLSEAITRSQENAAQLPGEMITALRMLRHLGVEQGDRGELKYRYVLLQLYAADGMTRLCDVLSKVCAHHDQPALHASALAGAHGLRLAALVLPAVQLLRAMLAQLVQCRNTRHKDLTCIPALLSTYTLMQAYPCGAWGAHHAARARAECVDALLAFTQPVGGVGEAETLGKSLWTLTVGQVVKYVTTGPQTFIPGLLILSEMLPLPLPVHTRTQPPESEAALTVHARKLWSAHLHPVSSSLADVITTLSSSGFSPLLQLLRRVCVQLADLAAPTALTVARALLDPLPAHLPGNAEATAHATRLLNFLACMASHAPVKACLVQLMSGHVAGAKGDDKYPLLVPAMCDVLTRVATSPAHVQAQECVIAVMQCLCDVETSLVAPDVALCNALPGRDLLVTMATALLQHLADPEQGSSTLLPAARTLLVLGEHDYTLYHLRACAVKCAPPALRSLFDKLCAGFSALNNTLHCALATSLEFLRVCLSCEGFDEARTLAITMTELATLLDWRKGLEHPVIRLEKLLQECAGEEEGLESLLENVSCLARLLEEEGEVDKTAEVALAEWVEPVLTAPDTLLAQFSARQVFQLGEVEEERLSSSYWLAPPPNDDLDQDMDQVMCDLLELSRDLLPDLQLTVATEQLCRAQAGLPSIDNDDVDLIKKRGDDARFLAAETRNKRPFVAPMRGRGFGRATPQRGDLFRSRPPNTSRPPSLHVDDFVALESSGQQPTGPTGYNKLAMRAAKDMIGARGRGRGRAFTSERGRFFPMPASYRRENGCGNVQRGATAQRGCNGRAGQAWTDGAEFEGRDMRTFTRSEEKFPARFAAGGRGLRPPAWPLKDHRDRFAGSNGRGLQRREPLRHTRTFTR